ncbi:MAG: NAD(P)(+) transhydrogenase (Re/Si-specific) subunit beta [Gammaproteobacteria bacterium]|nr:NAD(P)(+) transhydrogenase (Re/Si-specific) subunit beta [Gammaproteobacteria bacterium]MCP5137969.1 NAD(P)(+) transhydrogenase (Re/Si-specific) subunit beta [Gammaproteobacteria bacterium]
MDLLIKASYFAAAVLFILGLKRMSSPVTARGGIVWAGAGMVLATLITFLTPDMGNYGLMTVAIALGGIIAWWSGKRVAMTDMPQMIALYNGMGGGAAAAIACLELLHQAGHEVVNTEVHILAVIGALIGTIAFSGSLIAFAKLQGLMRGVIRFGGQQFFNLGVFVVTVGLGALIAASGDYSITMLSAFFVLALAFGVFMTVPIGGADMPVVISLYNALTGLAVGFEGFVLGNPAMMIAGTVVGAAGTLLTQLMARAMNRPITNVLFSNFGGGGSGDGGEVTGSMKSIEAQDVAVMMAFADKVVIVPGYGMAVAQAQHKIWELGQLLQNRGVTVKFAIHPVAGRMPGHMNVLLAEAGVPYDIIFDLDEINNEFASSDVSLVIGANDVVNPQARTNPESPIFGMPILDVDKSRNVIVIKRGQGKGFSGIENALFFEDNTRMLYGDGQKMAAELIAQVKELG